jgi:hypothetical protein
VIDEDAVARNESFRWRPRVLVLGPWNFRRLSSAAAKRDLDQMPPRSRSYKLTPPNSCLVEIGFLRARREADVSGWQLISAGRVSLGYFCACGAPNTSHRVLWALPGILPVNRELNPPALMKLMYVVDWGSLFRTLTWRCLPAFGCSCESNHSGNCQTISRYGVMEEPRSRPNSEQSQGRSARPLCPFAVPA